MHASTEPAELSASTGMPSLLSRLRIMVNVSQRETKGAVAAMEQGFNQMEAGTMETAKSGAHLSRTDWPVRNDRLLAF